MIAFVALALGIAATLQRPVDRPLQRSADLQRLDSLVRLEQWRDAIGIAERLATDSAGRMLVAQLRVNAGIAAYRQGNRAQAIIDWSGVVLEQPRLVEPAVNLATALLEERRTDSARAVVTRALRHHPSEGRLLALRARTLSGAAGMAATIDALKQLRREHPGNEDIGLELGHLLVASGGQNRLAGMVLYDTLVSSPTASERAFTLVSEFWMDAQQAQTAAQVADMGVIRYPRSRQLWTLLAEASAAREPPNWTRAATAYRRAIALARQPRALEHALMDVHLAAKDSASAIVLADTLLARNASDVWAIEMRGHLAARAGDTVRAIAMFTQALALDSSGPEPALALLDLRRPPPPADSARRLLRQAIWRGLTTLQGIELSSINAVSSGATPRQLERLRPQSRRREEVQAALRRALDTVVFHTDWGRGELEQLRLAYPRSALLARYDADVAARGQSAEQALATYERLVRRDPANAELQLRHAVLLERAGREDDAIHAYTRALDLAPENDSTFRSLQRLLGPRGTLDLLLTQVRRLRLRLPDSKLLGEHEVEVLSRMGRYAEAQAVAKQLNEKPGEAKPL